MEQRTDAMRVEIRAEADDGELTLLDLFRWLRQDPDVRDHARLSMGPPHHDDSEDRGDSERNSSGNHNGDGNSTGSRSGTGTGTMGAAEIIDLVLSQGFAALNLALAYAAWRTARPTAPAITITANGRSITVAGNCDDDTVRRIVAALDSAPPGTSPDAPLDAPSDDPPEADTSPTAAPDRQQPPESEPGTA